MRSYKAFYLRAVSPIALTIALFSLGACSTTQGINCGTALKVRSVAEATIIASNNVIKSIDAACPIVPLETE